MSQNDESEDITLTLGKNWERTNLPNVLHATRQKDNYVVPVKRQEFSGIMAKIGEYSRENNEIPDSLSIFQGNYIREVPGRRKNVCPT
jgi:hypothetical protein